jgi:predicted nucleic acid-binding protein
MGIFLDTSVLIPVFRSELERHKASLTLFSQLKKNTSAIAAHSLAEVYSTLTRLPGGLRVDSEHAMLFLGELRERCRIVALDENEYVSAIENLADQSITGGAVYDGLIAHCALKAKATALYTWNVKDFKRFGFVADRVKTPNEF